MQVNQQIFILAVSVAVVSTAVFLLIFFFIKARRLQRALKESALDGLEGHDFEFFCADLLESRGFLDVEVTKASRDYGVDILAEKDGVTYAIQCKRYEGPVGVKAVQEAYAGRDYYERMVGVVMTNQYFTQPAVEVAGKLRILLWDRAYLAAMLEEE